MDSRRFDSLARSLAAPRTRRGLLGALGALAAGLAGSRAGAQVTRAQCGNKVCAANPGVCTNGCVCCVWGNGNSRCRPPGECSGTVAAPTTTPAPITTTAAPSTTPAPTTTTAAPTTAAPTTTSTTTAASTTTTAVPTTTSTEAPTTTTTAEPTTTSTTAAPATTTTTEAPSTTTTAMPTTTTTTTAAPGAVCSPTLTCPPGQRCCGTDTCYVAENCDPAIGRCGRCTSTCEDSFNAGHDLFPVENPPCDGTDRTEAGHMCLPGTCQDNQVYCGPDGRFSLVDGVCREVCGAHGNYCPGGTACCASQICCSETIQRCAINPVRCVDICLGGADYCGDECCDPETQLCVGEVCRTRCGNTSCAPDTEICCTSACCDKSTRICGPSPGTCLAR